MKPWLLGPRTICGNTSSTWKWEPSREPMFPLKITTISRYTRVLLVMGSPLRTRPVISNTFAHLPLEMGTWYWHWLWSIEKSECSEELCDHWVSVLTNNSYNTKSAWGRILYWQWLLSTWITSAHKHCPSSFVAQTSVMDIFVTWASCIDSQHLEPDKFDSAAKKF